MSIMYRRVPSDSRFPGVIGPLTETEGNQWREDMENWANGWTPTGSYIFPSTYVIASNVVGGVTYYSVSIAYQTVIGGSGNAGGVTGTDVVAVVQAAFDALTNGGKIFFKIRVSGYDFGTNYLRVSYSNIHVDGEEGAYLKFSGAFSLVLGPVAGTSISNLVWCNVGLYNTKTDNTFTLIYIAKAEDIYFYNNWFRVDGGNVLSQGYFAKLTSTVDDTTKNINFFYNKFEHLGVTAYQISGLLIYRVNGLHVIGNTFVNVNDIIHSGVVGGEKHGLIYMGNNEYVTATTFHTEGHDVWDFHKVVWAGNVQYCSVDTGSWASGGMLIEHDCEDWALSGNVFSNGITFTCATGVAPQRIRINNNVFRGRGAPTPYAFVFSDIVDTTPTDVCIEHNSISNFLSGYINWLGAGWTGYIKFHQNSGLISENWGSSTGTGAQQIIPHGCSFEPTYAQIMLSESSTGGALPALTQAPSPTNIYVTATLNKTYNWRVTYNP